MSSAVRRSRFQSSKQKQNGFFSFFFFFFFSLFLSFIFHYWWTQKKNSFLCVFLLTTKINSNNNSNIRHRCWTLVKSVDNDANTYTLAGNTRQQWKSEARMKQADKERRRRAVKAIEKKLSTPCVGFLFVTHSFAFLLARFFTLLSAVCLRAVCVCWTNA